MSWHRPRASMSRLSTKRQAESFLCCPQGLLCPAHHPGRELSTPAACPGWFGGLSRADVISDAGIYELSCTLSLTQTQKPSPHLDTEPSSEFSTAPCPLLPYMMSWLQTVSYTGRQQCFREVPYTWHSPILGCFCWYYKTQEQLQLQQSGHHDSCSVCSQRPSYSLHICNL